ncbi:hypothetical protein WA158_006691 [Blastocystis sp. Blastoise]
MEEVDSDYEYLADSSEDYNENEDFNAESNAIVQPADDRPSNSILSFMLFLSQIAFIVYAIMERAYINEYLNQYAISKELIVIQNKAKNEIIQTLSYTPLTKLSVANRNRCIVLCNVMEASDEIYVIYNARKSLMEQSMQSNKNTGTYHSYDKTCELLRRDSKEDQWSTIYKDSLHSIEEVLSLTIFGKYYDEYYSLYKQSLKSIFLKYYEKQYGRISSENIMNSMNQDGSSIYSEKTLREHMKNNTPEDSTVYVNNDIVYEKKKNIDKDKEESIRNINMEEKQNSMDQLKEEEEYDDDNDDDNKKNKSWLSILSDLIFYGNNGRSPIAATSNQYSQTIEINGESIDTMNDDTIRNTENETPSNTNKENNISKKMKKKKKSHKKHRKSSKQTKHDKKRENKNKKRENKNKNKENRKKENKKNIPKSIKKSTTFSSGKPHHSHHSKHRHSHH